MIASDLNKRRKVLQLLLGGLRIRKLRPGFSTESDLIVCQVQAKESYDASFKVRGVFAEILDPECAATGTECAGYRDLGLRFVAGRRLPAIVFQSLQIIRGEFGYHVRAKSLINKSRSDFSEMFESYAEARASAISWVRTCLFETGDLQDIEPQGVSEPLSLSFSPRRARVALRWLPDNERRALVGDDGPETVREIADAKPMQETGGNGQQMRKAVSFMREDN